MVGEPTIMLGPKRFREVFFGFAVMSIFLYLGNLSEVILRFRGGVSASNSFNEVVDTYMLLIQTAAFVPSLWIFLYEGMAHSPYALFNKDYGNWDDVVLPGQKSEADYFWDYWHF